MTDNDSDVTKINSSKLTINDLKYIVMEGGGGKGAVYKGAISALESLMSKLFNTVKPEDLGDRKPAILDYYLKDDSNENPIIQGVAGASAGAITAFALALGLNSDEIEQILKYDFDNFLKNVDVGKYRMIDGEGNLSIGEDERNTETDRKEIGKKTTKFEFNFKQKSTQIGDNVIKSSKRNFIVDIIFKVLTDGVTSNLQQITNFLSSLFKNNSPEDAPPFLRGLLHWAIRPNNNLLAKMGVAHFIRVIFLDITIPKVLHLPIKIDAKSISALISDRGMFSGFAVREFFMDVIIYAATRKTILYKGLIKLFEKEDKDDINRTKLFGDLGKKINVSDIKLLLNYKDSFNIEDKDRRVNSKIGENDNLKDVLELLSNLTFEQLYEITKVNFGLSVSNYTTGMPLYFGYEWTPDFRVMEAVGASMSIPPAIKPLYNEADVIKSSELPHRVSYQIINNESNQFESKKGEFIRNDKTFDVKDYYFYEHIVKMALAQEMGEKGDFIDVNNAIELNSFMKKLKELVVGKIDDETGIFTPANIDKKTPLEKTVNGRLYTVDYALYKFFYNAQFKGLLIDGGYRNNIPYNFFRKKDEKNKLDNVLALKLDGSFPEPLMEKVYIHIKEYIKIENLLSKLDYNLENPEVRKLLEMLDTERFKVRTQVEIIFGNELAMDVIKLVDEKDKKERKKLNQQVKYNNDLIDRLTDESIANYKKRRQSAPWEQPKSIINIAFEGYAYGSEMGQVKDVSDHSHIVPLYSYGIGTYDFKMNKIKPLVALAQAKAEKKVKEFLK